MAEGVKIQRGNAQSKVSFNKGFPFASLTQTEAENDVNLLCSTLPQIEQNFHEWNVVISILLDVVKCK